MLRLGLIILSLSCWNLEASSHNQYDLQQIIDDHHLRLEQTPMQELNHYEQMIAFGLKKFSKGRLGIRLINYLATHENIILKFKNAEVFARKSVTELCLNSSPRKPKLRNVDDEVDALRHLLWSSYLAYSLNEEQAYILTSLQEDRRGNPLKSMHMDLWNNNAGINLVAKNQVWLSRLSGRKAKEMLKKLALVIFHKGQAKVIKTTEGHNCINQKDYPNFN